MSLSPGGVLAKEIQSGTTDKTLALELANQGAALRNQGHLEKSLDCYSRATDMDPELVRAWHERAGVLEMLQRASEAFSCYQKVVRLDPTHASAWHGVALYLLQQGKPAEALLCFNKVLESNPRHARALFGKGKCLSVLRNFDEALEAFDRSLSADPKHVPSWDEVGVCMDALKRHEEALSYYEEALQRDRRYVPALLHRGTCLNALDRYGEAIDCFEQAIDLDNNPVGHFHLAETWHRMEMYEEALASYEDALSLKLEFPDALYMKIVTLRKLGRNSDAVRTIKQFLTFATEKDFERKKKAQQWLEELEPAPKVAAQAPAVPEKFEVLEVLDRGGIGRVCKIRVRETGSILALKTFATECISEPAQKFLFRKEAKAWIDLGAHPNIVSAHFVEDFRGASSVGMDYIPPSSDGLSTLQEYLEQQPPDITQIRKWAAEICRGMAYVHGKGLRCHRDLKPSNIFVDTDGSARVSDFGIASVIGMASKVSMRITAVNGRPALSWQTRSGYSFGTPTHMSPEQFGSSASCDSRSDIYSFGVVLYQMVNGGRCPFEAALPPDTSEEHAWEYWNEMARLHREVAAPQAHSPLDSTIARCLQKNPADRYFSFSELLAEFESR